MEKNRPRNQFSNEFEIWIFVFFFEIGAKVRLKWVKANATNEFEYGAESVERVPSMLAKEN